MFLVAVARPRYDHHAKKMWDGKVGVRPFIRAALALRSSKNRPKGTPVTVPVTIDPKVYFDAVVNKVVSAILSKFPGCRDRGYVSIQQDNASPHKCVTTELLHAQGCDASRYESALTHLHERLGEEAHMEAMVNSLDRLLEPVRGKYRD
ncbi:hypothetical protein H257_18233 [Aphanomyces astaci]|uniref:Uncharacterized protein n=1 Tax=Aphanomyces astaci TaxID=112090 RepID=W4FDJ6_APHAT|nr:hypothetical protein H257_18233 [Aphanomyces astaci]ETV64964.1 hypothetical protein H257_18233 [Aphanomyces astaci]|eukprot:XP_009845554.1 hypothetical protein H257_18233 [Aphanomyces astaci]